MHVHEPMVAALQQAAATTSRMLERVPQDALTGTPHEQSMTLGRVAGHLAKLPSRFMATVTQEA